MSKKHDIIETWSRPLRNGRTKFYAHRMYPNGDVGESQSWMSRSGRYKRIRKMREQDPTLTVQPRQFKKK